MRRDSDEEYPEFVRRLREQARRDVEEMVPRPAFPVYGLAAPSLTPAIVDQTTKTNEEWTQIGLTYGRPEDLTGPYVTVTTIAVPPAGATFAIGMPTGRHGIGVEGELRFAVEREQDRAADWVDGSEAGGSPVADSPAEPIEVGREALPLGEALVVRQGDVWAARPLSGDTRVAVTVVGRGLSPESVHLEQVSSLRPLIEARSAEITRRVQRTRERMGPLLPAPDLPPAEGVAALRALADFSLASGAQIQASVGLGRAPRHGREWEWGRMYAPLWQRAIRERQRLAREDERAAEQVVSSAVNHLLHLAWNATWFSADERLREAAIDETLRHAMVDERVPSERAQYLWDRHWAERMAGLGLDPDAVAARAGAVQRFEADLSAAWEAWTANA